MLLVGVSRLDLILPQQLLLEEMNLLTRLREKVLDGWRINLALVHVQENKIIKNWQYER